ncbi:MAG: aminotransferase class I/II-fold pyridoxal phosphate-dependent enzyme [Anaerolineaceae bacterium]|nr:aminotransferase class I/II-fold pyridoxal phosphate-dependent enzyme [Anaerolineaceae bacterium]
MPQIADRIRNLPPYIFATISQQKRQLTSDGADIISMDAGSPDLPPPDSVIDALAHSARNPQHHGYAGYSGTPGFRAAVARHYAQRFHTEMDPDTEILPLLGSKEAVIYFSLAYLNAGDIALVPSVGYPSYSMGARIAGATVHYLPSSAKTGYLPDLSSLSAELAQKARILWLNYPNNPTGAIANVDDYQPIVDFCLKHDILLLSDNPYYDITYDQNQGISIFEVPRARPIAVELMSLSKTYNMAGWRLGAALGDAPYIKALLNLKSNVDSGHFRPVYDAGIEALDHTTRSWIEARNAIYERRRDLLVSLLPAAGLQAEPPGGAMYVWARVLQGNGADYARGALQHAHVSIAPGGTYGPDGEDYVRFSLVNPEPRIQEALDRLRRWQEIRSR